MASRTGSSTSSPADKRRRIDRSDAKAVVADEPCPSGSDGELLSASAWKSVRLWAAAPAPAAAAAAGISSSNRNRTTRTSAPRSPADVARQRFFDVRVDARDVEGHVLTAFVLRCDGTSKADANAAGRLQCPSSVLPRLTPPVQARLRKFECWPSPQDWEHIHGVTRLTGIDLLKTPFLTAAEWEKVAECLGCGKGSGGLRLWRNKVLAASLSVRIRAVERGQSASADAAGVFGDLPEDSFGDILALAGFSSAKAFSAASSKCRDMVRRHPRFRGSWRRNLFYAKGHPKRATARDFSHKWDWKVLCAEDVPDASLAPDTLVSAFHSLETRFTRGGLCSWQHDSCMSSQSLKEGVIMRNKYFGNEARAVRSNNLIWTDNKVRVPYENGETFSFFCRSPFGPSSSPAAVLGYRSTQFDARPGYAIMVLVGYDGFGGFIGAGRGRLTMTGRHDVTFCCRYLPPGDERLGCSVDRILSSLRSSQDFCEEFPWKSALFNLDYASEAPVITSPISSLKPAMPAIPGFKLQLQLVYDLCDFAAEEFIEKAKRRRRREEVDSNCCIECNSLVGSTSMVQYHDDEVSGLKDLLYQLQEQDLPFCSKDCFLKVMTEINPIHCTTNVTWQDQCWGCGSVGEACRGLTCFVWHFYDEDEDKASFGFLNHDAPVNFCSSKCALATLPIILKACKEYQSHDLSRGARKLVLFTDDWVNSKSFTDVFGEGDESVMIMKRNGWTIDDDGDWILEDPSKAADKQQSEMRLLSLEFFPW